MKKKAEKQKKPRKKRTTIKEAFDNGTTNGRLLAKKEIIDMIDNMLKEYKNQIDRYPRNSKFIELQYDALEELKEKLIYDRSFRE